MKITDALKKYRIKKANSEAILARISVYQIALKSNNLHLLGYYTRKPVEMGMPKARNNNSPVENEIFKTDDEENLTKELVLEWINEEKSSLWVLRVELEQIDAALNALTRQGRFIVELKYMDNQFWQSIERSYYERFKEPLTVEGLRKKCDSALSTLERILKPFYEKFGNIN